MEEPIVKVIAFCVGLLVIYCVLGLVWYAIKERNIHGG